MTHFSPKQYGRRTAAAMIVYVALMLIVWPQARTAADLPLKVLLALVPALPMLYVIWLMARRVLHGDELEQRTHLIGLGAATGVSAVFSLVCGFLAAARLFSLDAAAMILFWVFPLQMLSYAAVRTWVARRYGSDADCSGEGAWTGPARVAGAGVLLGVVALWGWWRGLDDLRLGMLTGMSASLIAAACVLYLRSRRRSERSPP
jgi:hypothetical protein